MTALKAFLWLYAVVGSAYHVMYAAGFDTVTRTAVGPLYALMVAAPVVFLLLVMATIASALGLLRH